VATRKFAGLRAELEKARHQVPTETQRETGGRLGRPTGGKRSHPDWTQHTVMLHKGVHRAAMQLLWQQEDRKDMSELLNELLANWVQQHQPKA
jgi:hypothetical protein